MTCECPCCSCESRQHEDALLIGAGLASSKCHSPHRLTDCIFECWIWHFCWQGLYSTSGTPGVRPTSTLDTLSAIMKVFRGAYASLFCIVLHYVAPSWALSGEAKEMVEDSMEWMDRFFDPKIAQLYDL